jgi:hypothetical protein
LARRHPRHRASGRLRRRAAGRGLGELHHQGHHQLNRSGSVGVTAANPLRTGTGRHRNVGEAAPPGAEPAEPTLEDGAVGGGSALGAAILAACLVLAGDDPPLVPLRLALAALAAAAAYVLDEPAAGAVDAVPRTRRRRTGDRIPAVAFPTGVWVAGIAAMELRVPSTPAVGLLVEGVGAVAIAVALAAVLRSPGRAEPGDVVASTVGVVILAGVVLDPPLWWPVPPFPVVAGWAGSTALRAALTVAAAAVVAASRDPYRRTRAGVQRSRRPGIGGPAPLSG